MTHTEQSTDMVDTQLVRDFGEDHDGDVFVSHRWQKHVYQTSEGSLIVPVHHIPEGATKGVTHMYRKPTGSTNFSHTQTLSDEDISATGDLNAGIVVEGSDGTLFAAGHSNPPPRGPQGKLHSLFDSVESRVRRATGRYTDPLKCRTNVVFVSRDDGKNWSVLVDETHQERDDPPHPHNLFWDKSTETLWWLVGHDGIRLRQYVPATGEWRDRYSGTIIEKEDRLPLVMERGNGRLWLGCEVSGPDTRQLFYSKDGGLSWTKIDHEFEVPDGEKNDGIWSISFLQLDGTDEIYVAGGRINRGKGFVKRSQDNGVSWETIYVGQDKSDTWATIIDGELFVADGPGPLFRIDTNDTISEYCHPQPTALADVPNFAEYGIKYLGEKRYVVGKTSLFRVK